MKNLIIFKKILLFVLAYSMMGQFAGAAPYQIKKVSFNAATFQFCLQTDLSNSGDECYHKLYLEPGTEMRYGFSSKATSYVKECFNRMINEYSRLQIKQTPAFEISGFITEGPGYSSEEPVIKFFHILDSKNLCDILP